jgi:hypothetical protein
VPIAADSTTAAETQARSTNVTASSTSQPSNTNGGMKHQTHRRRVEVSAWIAWQTSCVRLASVRDAITKHGMAR